MAAAGWALVAAAAGLAVVAQWGVGRVRDLAEWLSADGSVFVLEGMSDAVVAGLLRELAVASAVSGAGMLALRRGLGPLLAASPDSGRPESARVTWTESAFAVVVIGVGVALAACNLTLPMRTDEATTVLSYASQSFWHAWSTYDMPNNHVLHTLLVWVAHRLGGWDPVALRMPAFLAAVAALAATWWFVRREHGRLAAGFATALLGTSPLFVEYASNARGYTLMLLCFVLAMACGSEAARRPEAGRWWAGYAGAVGLGFFVMPLMALPAAVAVCWMLLLCWRERGAGALPRFALKTAAWSGAALGLAALLYAPVLAGAGPDALLNNQFVQAHAVPGGHRFLVKHTAVAWVKWHAATPAWAQVALAVALAAGMAAPGRRTGRGGLLAAAVAGMGAVLLVRPVVLEARMTLFLLFVSMVLAGAGAAVLWEAALGRALPKLRGRAPQAMRVAGVLAVAGISAGWATRPGVAGHFARETVGSPNAPALVAAVVAELEPGDYVAAPDPTSKPIAVYLSEAGHAVSLPVVVAFLGNGKTWISQIGGGEGGGRAARFFVFVDDEANWPAWRPMANPTAWDESPEAAHVARLLGQGGHDYCVAADTSGGKVFRMAYWPAGPTRGGQDDLAPAVVLGREPSAAKPCDAGSDP